MIPVKLRLRNFMCYRDNAPELLLEGVHVACLCGDNGAGKSALLDAITWALWGEARAKSDDDLIHITAGEMEVELDFEVTGNRYRIVRKRRRGMGKSAGRTLLELQVRTSGDGEYIPLTAGTVRETQRKLIDLLHMDYTTFINSAFLVQGRADEFTLRTPDKRKEILAEILGLRYYDGLSDRARDEARLRRDTVRALDLALAEKEQELSHRETHQAAKADLETRLAAAVGEIQALDARLSSLREQRQALDMHRARVQEQEKRHTQLAAEILRLRTQASALEREIAAYERVLAGRDAVEQGAAALRDAQTQARAFDAKSRTYLDLSQRKASLEQAIAKLAAALDAERRVQESRADGLAKRAAAGESAAIALPAVEASLAVLEALRDEVAQRRAEGERLTQEIAAHSAATTRLREEMESLRARIDQLASGQGTCPVCGTELGEDRCRNVTEQLEAGGKAKKAEFREHQQAAIRQEQAQRQAQESIRQGDLRLRKEPPPLERQAAALRHAREESASAAAELPQAQDALTDVQRRILSHAFAEQERAALRETEQHLAALGYDRAAHDAAQANVASLETFAEQQRALAEADKRLPDLRQRHAEATLLQAQHTAAAAALQRELDEGKTALQGLPALEQGIPEHDAARKQQAAAVDQMRQRLGAAERDLARLDDLARVLATQRSARDLAAREQAAYDELSRALGRSGVQALIIEAAIPEIEAEANRLLGRMTDNRMHLSLETQAGYRSQEGVKETLDIKIADELGTRSYETYSGGEAFRINLALRIALSRALARRAGAPLPTLFIDEGFGTQDPAGRERIAETINAISSDFQRIIVITHMDDLKEQFPARIEVAKQADGSTFWMS